MGGHEGRRETAGRAVTVGPSAGPAARGGKTVLKWLYFVLVAAFLGAVAWMLNDMRLSVNGLVNRLDQQLPPILTHAEEVAERLNTQLPRLLQNSREAAADLKTHLPQLLNKAQQGVDRISQLAMSFGQFKDLFRGTGVGPGEDWMPVAEDQPPPDEGQPR
jgi:hypothetical protein